MPQPQRMTSRGDALAILSQGEYGVLCTASDDGQPYGVPLNYCYDEKDNCVYFHCAQTGEKLKMLARNSKVSFVVVTRAEVVPEKVDTRYESVIVTGRAVLIEDEAELLHALVLLCERLAPDMAKKIAGMNCMPNVAIIRLTVDEITGKRNNEV
ncbi:MAG: pyridoxamine 5'-phosphate oxidase family protein [Acetanaerobacterium sp.]